MLEIAKTKREDKRNTAKLASNILKRVHKRKSALLDSFIVKKPKSWLLVKSINEFK